MSFESNPSHAEESPSELPEGAVESITEHDIHEPRSLRGPLAERLSMLGSEQYKTLLLEVFEDLSVTGESVESVVDEAEANTFFQSVVEYIQAVSPAEKESAKGDIRDLLSKESLA